MSCCPLVVVVVAVVVEKGEAFVEFFGLMIETMELLCVLGFVLGVFNFFFFFCCYWEGAFSDFLGLFSWVLWLISVGVLGLFRVEWLLLRALCLSFVVESSGLKEKGVIFAGLFLLDGRKEEFLFALG